MTDIIHGTRKIDEALLCDFSAIMQLDHLTSKEEDEQEVISSYYRWRKRMMDLRLTEEKK